MKPRVWAACVLLVMAAVAFGGVGTAGGMGPASVGSVGTGPVVVAAERTWVASTRSAFTVVPASATVTCDGDGQAGKRVQLLVLTSGYSGVMDDPLVASIASGVDAAFLATAQETGGVRHIRFVHDSACAPVILGGPVSSRGMTDFNTMVRDLKAVGYNRVDRKYLVFGATGCGWAQFENDDTLSAANRNNTGPHFALAGDQCKNVPTATHELAHILGAVNGSAPHATGSGHCTDDNDRMCYQDSKKVTVQILCADPGHENLLDCHHDDYFSTAPPAGSYLATHWNVANSGFLIGAQPLPLTAPAHATGSLAVTHSD